MPEVAGPVRIGADGWADGVCRHPSPNVDARPEGLPIDLIVLHNISLPPARFGTDDVLDFFANTLDCGAHPYFEQLRGVRVSAHFFIRRTGACVQFAPCDTRAWHAGVSDFFGRTRCNDFSIGIEIEGRTISPSRPPSTRRRRPWCGRSARRTRSGQSPGIPTSRPGARRTRGRASTGHTCAASRNWRRHCSRTRQAWLRPDEHARSLRVCACDFYRTCLINRKIYSQSEFTASPHADAADPLCRLGWRVCGAASGLGNSPSPPSVKSGQVRSFHYT